MQSMIASQHQLIRRSMNKDINDSKTDLRLDLSESLNSGTNETITSIASNSSQTSTEWMPSNSPSLGTDYNGSDVRRSGPKNDKKRRSTNSWLNILIPSYKTRHEEFKRLFSNSVPNNERLVVDYSCALQKDILIHGRLYLSLNYISFYANIFKWETSLVIKCRDITSLTKAKTARVIPNAIQVVTTSGDRYVFTSFAARDKTYIMFFRIWQNALLGQPMSSAQLWQWVHFSYGEDLGLTSEDDEEYYSDDLVHTLTAQPQVMGSHNSSETDLMTEQDIYKDCSESNEGISNCECGQHEGQLVMDNTFHVSIDRAFELIFTDSKFINNLHKSRKTYDLKVTEWNDSPKEKTRQLTYTVVVNSSIIKSAQTIECQFLLSDGTHGNYYTIRSEVENLGIPYCDSFTIYSLWCLTRESEELTRIRVHTRVVFKKSWGIGFIKSTIEKNSIQGFIDFCADLSEQLHNWLQIEHNLGIVSNINDLEMNVENIDSTELDTDSKDSIIANSSQLLNLTPVPHKSHWFSSSNAFLMNLIIIVLFLSLFLNCLILSHIWQMESKMIYSIPLSLDSSQMMKNPNYLKEFVDNCIKMIKTIETNLNEIKTQLKDEL